MMVLSELEVMNVTNCYKYLKKRIVLGMDESGRLFEDPVAEGLLHGITLPETIEGIFNGFSVTVKKPSHINTLYDNGCFGKGSLSKSKPFSTLHRQLIPSLYKQTLTETEEKFRVLAKMKEMYERYRSQFAKWQESSNENISIKGLDNIDELFKQKESLLNFSDVLPKDTETEPNTNTTVAGKHLPPSEEVLLLNLEEAFFLVHDLKWLNISFERKKLSVYETWLKFCETQSNFVYRYLAYRYFRSNNWVVKSGLKYGSDFLLYKQRGPDHFHSSYMVIIDGYLGKERDTGYGKFSDSTINQIIRLAESAGKEAIIAKVVLPYGFDHKVPDINSCLENCSISSSIMHRWTPTYPIPSEFSVPGSAKIAKFTKKYKRSDAGSKRKSTETEYDLPVKRKTSKDKESETISIMQHLLVEDNVSLISPKKELESIIEKVI